MARPTFRERLASLLGVTVYQPDPRTVPGLPLQSSAVDLIRETYGGNLETLPVTKLHWFLSDLEVCQAEADRGDMQMVGMLAKSMRRDGTLRGLLDVRSSVASLPRRFNGGSTPLGRQIIEVLQTKNGSDRAVFDEMYPVSEVSRFIEDGIVCGIGVAENIPVKGRDFPVMCRRLPQNLWYYAKFNQWYYRTIAGNIPITPGLPDENGHSWMLYTPGGAINPWDYGLWPALGRAFIAKEHSFYGRQNYAAKLANPARVAQVPVGASEPERKGFLRDIIAWGLNTVFELPTGWEVKLLESNGRGFEVFQADIATCNQEYATALCGNTVMMDGGVGFQNADIFRMVTQDLIRTTAESAAHVLNTQGLMWWVASRWGFAALENAIGIEYDTTPPKDKKVEADTLTSFGNAVKGLTEALTPLGRTVNVDELAARFGIPMNELNPLLMAGASDAPRLVDSAPPTTPVQRPKEGPATESGPDDDEA